VRRGEAARSELRAWYLGGLRPKLARAVRDGAVDAQAAAAFHADLRRLLELGREHDAA